MGAGDEAGYERAPGTRLATVTMTASPLRIGRKDPARIQLDWQDGASTVYTAAQLRRLCPCAHCVHELTGQRLLDPASVPDDLTQTGVELVGAYAIAVRFADGHSTGIFPWPFLREHDPAAAGASEGPEGA